MLSQNNHVDGIPKRDAAKELRISERTLDRKLYDLQIECKQITVPGRRPLVVIAPDDYARIRGEMIPVTVGVEEETTALITRPARNTVEMITLLRTALAAPALPLFLTLRAASAYSGLTQAFLKRQIEAGTLKAVKDRGWRISRHDLDNLAT